MNVTELESRLASTPVPHDVADALRRRLNQSDGSPESQDRIARALRLPWSVVDADRPQFAALHSSLVDELAISEPIADLICDHLVVREYQLAAEPAATGPRGLLCLVGPPGVGKSYIAHQIAEQLGLPAATIQLDRLESADDLFGNSHMPGEVMAAIERLGQSEVVLVLEELDAIGGSRPAAGSTSASVGGSWSATRAALLNALTDATARRGFRDQFFDVPFDLSRVLVVSTARWLPDIPPLERSRLDIVDLAGYVDDDKIAIARDSLAPTVLSEYQVSLDNVTIEDDALSALVRSYTVEPGVDELDGLLRQVVRRALSNQALRGDDGPLAIAIEDFGATIGRPTRLRVDRRRRETPGQTAAAVVRRSGGVLGHIEAVQMPGSGQIRILDTLGENLTARYRVVPSYVRSRLSDLGVSARSLEEFDTDLLLPASELPGDEGSLALAATIAMVSLMRDRAADPEFLAIGGMTSHGHVRRALGVQAKILAAHRSGIRRVVLPRQNEHDLDSLPEPLHDAITFIPIDEAGQGINVALR
jgi:ATP-dependent Lon protease